MNAAASPFARSARLSGMIGATALVVATLIAWRSPGSFAPAWRCAVFACVGPALGSLVFVLLYEITGGEWGRTLRPFLLGGTRLLPWSWLLLLPLVAGAIRSPLAGEWWRYSTPMGLALRAIGYGAVFFFLSALAVRAWPREGHPAGLAWVGPAGLIGVVFMSHLLASDWLAALDPHWISTAFPVTWLIGQAVAGLAAAVLVALLAGADPARPVGRRGRIGIDWGTLLFATAMLWCYVAFAQFLIVWSGNLPPEASWYARRLAGGWRFFPPALLALHFIAPLIVLLSRRAKQNRRALAAVAAMLLGAQLLQTAWLILPAFPDAPVAMPWLALVLVLALGGIFANRYLVASGREWFAR